jgi:hypothetical protein
VVRTLLDPAAVIVFLVVRETENFDVFTAVRGKNMLRPIGHHVMAEVSGHITDP